MAIMALSSIDRYLGIEVEGDVENGKQRKRNLYFVQLSVADTVVAKSPRSSVLKWKWNANNQMWVLVLWLTSQSKFTFWNQLLRATINDES